MWNFGIDVRSNWCKLAVVKENHKLALIGRILGLPGTTCPNSKTAVGGYYKKFSLVTRFASKCTNTCVKDFIWPGIIYRLLRHVLIGDL